MPESEKNYFVLPIEDDKLVFALTARETEPQKHPAILYDGGAHALFYRNEGETVVLDWLHKKARSILSMGGTVAMTEIDADTEKVARQYPVIVTLTPKLPAFKLK